MGELMVFYDNNDGYINIQIGGDTLWITEDELTEVNKQVAQLKEFSKNN